MAKPVALSQDDAAVLRRVIDQFRHLLKGEANRSGIPLDNTPAPEMYVALTAADNPGMVPVIATSI